MADAPLNILFEMVMFLLNNTISTLQGLGGMFFNLLTSFRDIISITGWPGLIVSAAIIMLVAIVLLKFAFGAGKTIITLVIAGLIILFFILMLI